MTTQFQNDLFNELDKKIMTWDVNMKEWYPIAMQALKFSSCATLGISESRYGNLLMKEETGLRMTVANILSKNLTMVSPVDMGYEVSEWADILKLNTLISKRLYALAKPIEESVKKRHTIMNANQFQMKSIPKA